ncbi:MAG: cytochrome c [Opitutae bacterium]|nr:cytochrome c [Opitutae bacterium]
MRSSSLLLAGLCVTWLHASAADVPTFHGNAMRTGWIDDAPGLAPRDVAGDSFGELWQSPQLDWLDGRPPRLYATPLYLDDVAVNSPSFPAARSRVVFAATSNGFVYAINAFATPQVPAGAILWRTWLARLAQPTFDGINIGVMSTPVIDPVKKILYVTSCASAQAWQVFALDVGSGRILPGWPVAIDAGALAAPGVNRNAPPEPVAPGPPRALFAIQRGALNLSPDGSHLYVTFGEAITGWLVAIDTGASPRIASAFASVRYPHRTAGGVWGAGGPAIDPQGNIFVGTGANFNSLKVQPYDWTQSVLQFSDSPAGLVLRGTYTPFNYGDTANADIDLGSGGACLIPALDAGETATPHLMAIGGKQGNVYLLDRAHLPGGLVERPPVGHDSASDASLLSPAAQPQFGRRGPLNVFGPYSETKGAIDKARSRSVPAYFRSAEGRHFLFVTGQTKVAEDADAPTAPCLARLRIVTTPGQPAYLEVDQFELSLVFGNPGSPVVSSQAGREGIVWVLDENAARTALLIGDNPPRPVLYALDALTLKLLWRSPEGALHTSGKYNEPLIVRDTVFVGTDRIQAFGRRSPEQKSLVPASPSGALPAKPPGAVAASPGLDLYLTGGACAVCHGIGGAGLAGVYPPLAGSEWVNGSEERLIRIMLHGLQGPITVSGKDYNGAVMPGFGQLAGSPFNWDDGKIAQVLTYIRHEWGNTGGPIAAETVTRIRQQTGKHEPWTRDELLKVGR